MEINTKYNIGDKVFLISQDKIKSMIVAKAITYSDASGTKIEYNLKSSTGNILEGLSGVLEKFLFASKQELCDAA